MAEEQQTDKQINIQKIYVKDFSFDSQTRERYGMNSNGQNMLLARRLVERGVRFVQICTKSQIWDNHSKIVSNITDCCAQTDQGVAALLKDL